MADDVLLVLDDLLDALLQALGIRIHCRDERITTAADVHRAHGDIGDVDHGGQTPVLTRLTRSMMRGNGCPYLSRQIPVNGQLSAAIGVRDAQQVEFGLQDGDVLTLDELQHLSVVIGEPEQKDGFADVVEDPEQEVRLLLVGLADDLHRHTGGQ